MYANVRLTGKHRFRTGGFFNNKLIAQVEEVGNPVCPHGGMDGPDVFRWRDATVKDISALSGLKFTPWDGQK